jgi:uncharacterized membrane protein
MKKEEFLSELRRALGGMREEEKKDIAADYEEHFRMGAASGKSEEEIARSLGNPRVLGKSYSIDAMLEEGKVERNASTVLRAVFAFLTLGFLNIVVMLGPFIAAVAVIVSFWASALAMAVSGIVTVIAAIVGPVLPSLVWFGGLSIPFVLFAGIGVAALGLLWLIGMWFLTRWFIFAVGKYVQFNAKIVSLRGGNS